MVLNRKHLNMFLEDERPEAKKLISDIELEFLTNSLVDELQDREITVVHDDTKKEFLSHFVKLDGLEEFAEKIKTLINPQEVTIVKVEPIIGNDPVGEVILNLKLSY